MKKLAGVWPAIVTPFRDGVVDHEALGSLCTRAIEAGVAGLVACGTTGEGATLDQAETLAVTRTVLQAAGDRVPVIVGSGSNDTRRTVALTEQVAGLGVRAVLVVTPYYNKPNPEGILLHYRAVAEVGAPVLVYNVPGRTGLDLGSETLLRLAQIPGIEGVKDASRDPEKTMTLRQRLGDDFALLSGDDFTILPYLACGGDGVISVVANVAPAATVALVAAFERGDLARARALQVALLPLIRTLFLESNPIPLKGLLARRGAIGPELRAPLAPASPATLEAAADALSTFEKELS